MSLAKAADAIHDSSRALSAAGLEVARTRRESLWMAFISFLIYGAAAVYLNYGLHYAAGDAMSRVANGDYVLFSHNPHLGAIGFVWNPLPSLLELPLVALHPLLPAVVTRGLAGLAVSAVLGATAVYYLNRILDCNMALPRALRIVITAVFALNPLIVVYGANGMSDIMWVACILGTYSGLLDFLQDGALRRLVSSALWLAAGFGMRYEAIPFGFMLILAMVAAMWGREPVAKWSGAAIIFSAPIVFASGVWIYFNWLIMKNPFYFLDSSYSNLAQTSTGAYMTPAIAAADHHLLGSLQYVVRFGELYWPIYIGFAAAIGFCFKKRRDPRAIVLVFGTIGAELLELVLLYKGNLGEWDRYFLEFIPNGILLGALALSKLQSVGRGWSQVSKIALGTIGVLVLVSGSVGTAFATQQAALGQPDGIVIKTAFDRGVIHGANNNPFYGTQSVIRYIDDHPKMTILADTFIDWPIVIRVHHLNQFIITSDYSFHAILHNPRGRVTAFLIPKPSGVAQLDAINRAWPGMWAGHVPWAQLMKSFPGPTHYRLYKILPSAP